MKILLLKNDNFVAAAATSGECLGERWWCEDVMSDVIYQSPACIYTAGGARV